MPVGAWPRSGTGDEDDPFLPGLIASFRDDKGHTAARLDPRLAFHWGEMPPDSRLTAGAFRAAWQGSLLTALRGDYRFFVFGTGEIELKIAGRVAIMRQTLRDRLGIVRRRLADRRLSPAGTVFSANGEGRSFDVAVVRSRLRPGADPAAFPLPSARKACRARLRARRLLARVLRCGRCHGEEQSSSPAPALDRLNGNLSREWLIRWLTAGEHAKDDRSPRRMPAFALTDTQADRRHRLAAGAAETEAIAPSSAQGQTQEEKLRNRARKTGERLFLTLGCLACHSWRDLGASGWLGGGDLTHIADKRPGGFFAAWLADPARLNRDHRMPTFPLSDDERTSLALSSSPSRRRGKARS